MNPDSFNILKETIVAHAADDVRLMPSMRQVLQEYLTHLNPHTGICIPPSIKYLTAALDITSQTIHRANKHLLALGYIKRTGPGYGFHLPKLKEGVK
jgi:hypothetical protein